MTISFEDIKVGDLVMLVNIDQSTMIGAVMRIFTNEAEVLWLNPHNDNNALVDTMIYDDNLILILRNAYLDYRNENSI
jgi:hypothetical protein